MKLLRHMRFAAVLLAAPAMWAAMSNAYAVGTASGTSIDNQATLTFTVQGVGQPNVLSNVESFVVDNRVDITVTWQDAANVPVAAGQTQASVLEFLVTNSGNATQDFSLSASNDAGDQFDPGTIQIFVESGATAGYQAVEDTATFVDELGADLGATVYLLVSNIPGGLNAGDLSNVNLIAQAGQAGGVGAEGVPEAETAGADTAGVDVVWGDGAGSDDGVTDGLHSAQGTAEVVEAQIAVAKSAVVLRDPFSGATNPKAIPGAIVRYTITITNAAAASGSATLTQITDALVATIAMDADLTTAAGAPENAAGDGFRVDQASARPTTPATRFFTTAADLDGADHDGSATGGTVTANFATILPADGAWAAGELRPGDSVTLIFNVVVQ